MANPNLMAAGTTLYKEGTIATLASGAVSIVTNASGSGAVIEIQSVVLSQQNDAASAKGTVTKQRADGVSKVLAGSVTVAAGGVLPIRANDNPLVLLEGESVLAKGATTIDIEISLNKWGP